MRFARCRRVLWSKIPVQPGVAGGDAPQMGRYTLKYLTSVKDRFCCPKASGRNAMTMPGLISLTWESTVTTSPDQAAQASRVSSGPAPDRGRETLRRL